ncbi:MAG: ribosomal RNA small subunit methyltransferase A [Fimbriimonadaceae bacterium]|nr:ribosomal RNA small subunit methyltransferase A [Fimbriimonadaceae bacterium]
MNLHDQSELRAFLAKHGLWARKGLAQHFLCSPKVLNAIRSRLDGIEGILEIGPGPGAITGMLTEAASKVIALEVDTRFPEVLAESAPLADVRLLDALEADLGSVLFELPEPRSVVSNMPYHITGPLITRIAEVRKQYVKAVLMMQKEVGVRILAPVGDSNRGSLSVYLQTQFQINKVCDVPPGAFLPPPKVQSIVLEFVPVETGLSAEEEPGFFKLVRGCFAMPRKTLANNLIRYGIERPRTEALIEKAGLSALARPQSLTLDQWRELYRLSVLGR